MAQPPAPAADGTHAALKRLQAIGIDNLLDDSIKPRASRDGLIHAKKTRTDEPDTRILSLREWPQNLVMDMDRLARECQSPRRVKALLLRHVRQRQGDVHASERLRRRIRLVREVHAHDIQMALMEVRDGVTTAAGAKRKPGVDSPLDGPEVDGAEEQPMRKKKTVRFVNDLVPGGEEQRASSSSSSSSAERPATDTSVTTHAPSDEALAAFERNSHQCYWAMELLIKDLDRLDEITRLIGPKTHDDDGDSDASEASSKFAGHLIASARLSDATRDMAGTSADEFLEHYRLRVEDERTHLDHQRAVVEASARKLCKFIREDWSPPLLPNKDLQERIKALLD